MLVTAITCNTRTFVVQADSGPQRDHAPLPVCYPSPSTAPSRRRQWGNYKYKLSGHHGKFSLWLIWQDGEKQPIAECDKQAVACSDSIMSILDAESHRYIFLRMLSFCNRSLTITGGPHSLICRHGLKGVNIHYLGARLGKDIKDIRWCLQ